MLELLIKQSKDRVTILACANAFGSCRLPLTFIHKSTKPRYFKHEHGKSSCSLLRTTQIMDGFQGVFRVVST